MRRIWIANVRKYALVDDEDYDEVSRCTWTGVRNGNYIYCQTSIIRAGKPSTISMHRMIMRSRRSIFFVDGNGLNCQKTNLSSYRANIKGKMTGDLQSFILGTLLGDGGASIYHKNRKRRRFRLALAQGEKQKEYLFLKAELLHNYIKTQPRKVVNSGYGKYNWAFNTCITSDFDFLDMCYDKNGKKYVSQEWVDSLTWLSLAYWYMDDGTLNGRRNVVFCTHGLSKEECARLVRALKNMGYSASLRTHRAKRKRRKQYYVIRLDYFSSKAFLDQISHLVPRCLKYKIDIVEAFKTIECAFCGDTTLRRNQHQRSCQKPQCRKKSRKLSKSDQYRKRKAKAS